MGERGGGAAARAARRVALAAGVVGGLYIVFGQAAGRIGEAAASTFGMVIAALVILPFGVASAGTRLLDPSLLPLALAVAVLSSALPYSLEMFALTREPRTTIGALM